jgi:hypothetical protein
MCGFFALLERAGVHQLNDAIARRVKDAGLDLRSERVIDKFLWLRGSADVRAATAEAEREAKNLFAEAQGLERFAEAVAEMLPDNFFDPMRNIA